MESGLVIGRQVHYKLSHEVCVPAVVTYVPEFVEDRNRIHYMQVDLFVFVPSRFRVITDVNSHREREFVHYDKAMSVDNTWHWPNAHQAPYVPTPLPPREEIPESAISPHLSGLASSTMMHSQFVKVWL